MIRRHSPGREALRKILNNRLAVWGLICITLYAAVALLVALGGLPFDAHARVGASYAPPSAEFWLGTDFLGRDVFAKVLHGTRIAFSVGLVASAIAIPIGAILGLFVGIAWAQSRADAVDRSKKANKRAQADASPPP